MAKKKKRQAEIIEIKKICGNLNRKVNNGGK